MATTAQFNLTNIGIIAAVTAFQGDGQSTEVNKTFGTALAVSVSDAQGRKLVGVPVTFSLPSTGASGSFPNNAHTAVVLTSNDGRATSPVITANDTPGAWQASVSA